MPDPEPQAHLLYAVLRQVSLKNIDWNLVGDHLGISNGHAARMRYSRFKKQMDGKNGILKAKNSCHNKAPAKTPRKIKVINRTPWEDIQRRIKQEDAEINAVHFDQENWATYTGGYDDDDDDVAGSQVPTFALPHSSSTEPTANSDDTRRFIEDESHKIVPSIGDTNSTSVNEGMNASNDNIPAESQLPKSGDPQSSPPNVGDTNSISRSEGIHAANGNVSAEGEIPEPADPPSSPLKPTVQLNETDASTENQQNMPVQTELRPESDVGQMSEQDCTRHIVPHVTDSGGFRSPSPSTEASSNLGYANTVAANSSIGVAEILGTLQTVEASFNVQSMSDMPSSMHARGPEAFRIASLPYQQVFLTPGRKRKRELEGQKSPEEESRIGCYPNADIPTTVHGGTNTLMFACPYRKHDPGKYSISNWKSCATTSHKTIARLKQHLYRHHLSYQCPRCKLEFKSSQTLHDHIATEACNRELGPLADGITAQMKERLQCRKKSHRGQSDESIWKGAYRIIFPDDDPPSPWFEPIKDFPSTDTPKPSQQEDVQPAEYANLRREFFQQYKDALQAAANNGDRALDDRFQTQLIDFLNEAQDKVLSKYCPEFGDRASMPSRPPPREGREPSTSNMKTTQTSNEETLDPPPQPSSSANRAQGLQRAGSLDRLSAALDWSQFGYFSNAGNSNHPAFPDWVPPLDPESFGQNSLDESFHGTATNDINFTFDGQHSTSMISQPSTTQDPAGEQLSHNDHFLYDDFDFDSHQREFAS